MGNVAIFKGKLVKFLAKAGILLPRRPESERSISPEPGETAFDTTFNKIEVYDGTSWVKLGNSTGFIHPTTNSTYEDAKNNPAMIGTENTAVGVNSFNSLTEGSGNTGLGASTGDKVTNGFYNTLVGANAGKEVIGGSNNTLVGYGAGDNITFGEGNIAIGVSALDTTTTGYSNIAIGKQAADSIVNGFENTAIGYNSLNSLTSGNNNIAIGNLSLPNVTTGFDNVAIGNNAGVGFSTNSKYNTIINAVSPLTSAAYNGIVTIGRDSTGDWATAVTSNEFVLGTSLHNYKLPGTIITDTKISVNSSLDALRITQVGSGNALAVEDSANPDSTPFVIKNDGKVIIGHTEPVLVGSTTNPRPLEIIGTSFSTSGLSSATFSSTDYPVMVLGKSRGATIGDYTAVQSNDFLGSVSFSGSDGTDLQSGAASLVVQVDGTVANNSVPAKFDFRTTGVGETAPVSRMTIDSAGIITTTGNQVINANTTTDALRITQIGTGNALVVEDDTNPDSTPFVISQTGEVLVGRPSPVASGLRYPVQITKDSDCGLTVLKTGNDTIPNYIMLGKTRGTGNPYNTAVVNGDLISEIRFLGDSSTSMRSVASIVSTVSGTVTSSSVPGNISFKTTSQGDTGPTERMLIDSAGVVTTTGTQVINANASTAALRITQVGGGNALLVEDASSTDTTPFVIDASGNVGIGKSTPTTPLDVTGIAKFDTQLLMGGPNAFVRDYASGYSATHTPTTPYEIGRITFTGNSQNVSIIGEIRGSTSASNGTNRFILNLRSQTLPVKDFTVFEEEITNLGRLIRIKVYQDTTTGLVALAYTCDSSLQNIGWSLKIQERGDYNYFQQVTTLTALNTTGLTEVPLTSATRYLSAGIESSTGTFSIGSATTTSTTLNLNTAATTTGNTKSINIGTAGLSGSTTNITLGSAVAGATNSTTINGTVTINGTSAQSAEIRLAEDTDNGTNYVGLRANSSIASNFTLTLPAADGLSGQSLSTDGAGNLNWSSPGVFKNKLINGNFDIWQRITPGTSAVDSNGYLADRWKQGTGVESYVRQPITGITAKYAAIISRTTATSGDLSLIQRIESVHTYPLSGKNVTLSFYTYQSTGTAIPIRYRVLTPTTADDYTTTSVAIAETTLATLTNNWQKVSVTFTVTSTMASNGFQIMLGNSAVTGPVGIAIGQVQLEEGNYATAFEHRPYNTELTLCQSYAQVFGGNANFEKLPALCVIVGSTVYAAFVTVTNLRKSNPTFILSANSNFSVYDGATQTISSFTADAPSFYCPAITITLAAALTTGRAAFVQTNTTAARMIISAEL